MSVEAIELLRTKVPKHGTKIRIGTDIVIEIRPATKDRAIFVNLSCPENTEVTVSET